MEAILNSYPVVPLEAPTDNGSKTLTPGHFLIGRALLSLPSDPTTRKNELLPPDVGICCTSQWMSFGVYGVLSTYDMSTTTTNGQEMDVTSGKEILLCALIYMNLVVGVGFWLES